MPSPFPGMDPFIESQRWRSFQNQFLAQLARALVEQVRPRYSVDVEQDVYLVRSDPEQPPERLAPDVAISEFLQEAAQTHASSAQTVESATATLRPVIRTLPLPRKHVHRYLAIRNRDSNDVVTVLELLSPTNKSDDSGRKKYLKKRGKVLAAGANLVELDLLRRGPPLPTVEPLPDGDYFAFVCRNEELPRVHVYAWPVSDKLPDIPVPLGSDDPDAVLTLQEIFTDTYEGAGLDYTLNYGQELTPPLGPEAQERVRQFRNPRTAEKE